VYPKYNISRYVNLLFLNSEVPLCWTPNHEDFMGRWDNTPRFLDLHSTDWTTSATLITNWQKHWSLSRIVNTANGCRLDGQGSISDRGDGITFTQLRPDSLWLPPPSTWVMEFFPKGQNTGGVKMATKTHLVPRMRMLGFILQFPHIFFDVEENLAFNSNNSWLCFQKFPNKLYK